MQRNRWIAVAGAVALALGTAVTTVGGEGRDTVAAGGWRLLNGVGTAEFELGANSAADGSDAHGAYTFSRGGIWFAGEVTCLRVTGDLAVAGGRVTDGNIPGAIGFLVWLDDAGAPAGGQPGPDAVSFTLVSPDDPMWPDGVSDVPLTCPSTDLPAGVEWRSVEGNVTVHDR